MAQRTCDDEDRLCPIGREDEVMKGCLAKGYFQDEDEGLSCKGLLPRWGQGMWGFG